MEAALGIPEAIISAGCPDRIRETLPKRTLLTYLVPSSVITKPSLPPSTAYSVLTNSP